MAMTDSKAVAELCSRLKLSAEELDTLVRSELRERFDLNERRNWYRKKLNYTGDWAMEAGGPALSIPRPKQVSASTVPLNAPPPNVPTETAKR